MIRHTSSSIFLWPDWVLPSLCVLIKIMTILGHILRPRWSQEEWLFVELCSRSLDESYIVRCWSKMIFLIHDPKCLLSKKTLGWFKKKSVIKTLVICMYICCFLGTKYDPVIWQGTILNHYQCQCYCYQVFFWTLVWFQLQGFRSWQMLAWWVALRSLQKMLLPVPVCHASYKNMTWKLEQKWLEDWNKNDLKTGTKMTWKLILEWKNKDVELTFGPWIFLETLGNSVSWKTVEAPVAMWSPFGFNVDVWWKDQAATKAYQTEQNGQTICCLSNGLIQFSMGFFWGWKFVQPKFEDPKCWNLKKTSLQNNKKTTATPCGFFIKRSA